MSHSRSLAVRERPREEGKRGAGGREQEDDAEDPWRVFWMDEGNHEATETRSPNQLPEPTRRQTFCSRTIYPSVQVEPKRGITAICRRNSLPWRGDHRRQRGKDREPSD